jgi:hypothetical protein
MVPVATLQIVSVSIMSCASPTLRPSFNSNQEMRIKLPMHEVCIPVWKAVAAIKTGRP